MQSDFVLTKKKNNLILLCVYTYFKKYTKQYLIRKVSKIVFVRRGNLFFQNHLKNKN